MTYYVCTTHTGREIIAEQALREAGYPVYNPKCYHDNLAHRRKDEQISMFPGYVFVELEVGRDDFHSIRYLKGVKRGESGSGLVTFGDQLAICGPAVMDSVRRMEAMAKPNFYKPGDKVIAKIEIRDYPDGPVRHFELPADILSLSGKKRAEVLVNLLGSMTTMTVYLNKLEPVTA